MSTSLRNGIVAFAAAAAAVLIISIALVLAVNRSSDDSSVGQATSVTPAVLGASETPRPAITP